MSIPNETCANAVVIPSLPYDVIIDNTTAGNSPGSDTMCLGGAGLKSAWYKLTIAPGIYGIVCKLDSFACDVTISKGATCGSLVPIACAEGGRPGTIVAATEGDVFYFVITSFSSGSANNHLFLTIAEPTGDFCKILSVEDPTDPPDPPVPGAGGIYFINPAKSHDTYYNTEKKIPNPTVRTALIGE